MLYIKIQNTKYPAEISTYPTQLGNTAIKVKSEAPLAEGFLIVDENDKVISDKSDFKYLYMEEENAKDYTNVVEQPIPTQSFYVGNTAVNPLQRQINSLNKRVSDITPYEQSKVGYYGENEKVFYGVPNGNVSVFFDNYTGDYSTSRIEDRFTITFHERLTDQTKITIMVQ